MYFNKVIMSGNIIDNPVLNKAADGTNYTKFDIETEDSYKKGKTVKFSVICFNKVAQSASIYLKQGDTIIIDGGLSVQQQKNAAGNVINKYIVVAKFITYPNKGTQYSTRNQYSDKFEMSPTEVAMFYGVEDKYKAKPYEPNIKKTTEETIKEDLEFDKKNFGRGKDDKVTSYELGGNEKSNYDFRASEDINRPDPNKDRRFDSFEDCVNNFQDGDAEYIEF